LAASNTLAPADAGVLHRGAVSVGDLAVVEQEHHGHGLAGLPDRPEARCDRFTGVSEPVVCRTGTDGGLVVGEESGPDRDAEHIGDEQRNSQYQRPARQAPAAGSE
jgi:hypothetical protein